MKGKANPMEKERCDFCGKKKIVESTTFVGRYCKECHETNIAHSKEAVELIQTRKRHGLYRKLNNEYKST